MKTKNIIELKNEYKSNFEKICHLESELAILLMTNEKIKKILIKLGEMEDSDSSDTSSDDDDVSICSTDSCDSIKTIEHVELVD